MNLAAASRVESGAVENQRRAWGFDDTDDLSVEMAEKRIAVI